jgi:hypothetical protein
MCSKIIGKHVMCDYDKKTLNKVHELVATNNSCQGRLFEAVSDYAKLKSRDNHPEGIFDKVGRWYPNIRLTCCGNIRSPSRNFPLSLNKHCRSAEHVANIHQVDKAQMVKAYNLISKIEGDFDNLPVFMCTILVQDLTSILKEVKSSDSSTTASGLVM